jgi:hypothetical protein
MLLRRCDQIWAGVALRLQEKSPMSDKSFGLFMALAMTLLVILMSTPLSGGRVSDAAARLRQHLQVSRGQPVAAAGLDGR